MSGGLLHIWPSTSTKWRPTEDLRTFHGIIPFIQTVNMSHWQSPCVHEMFNDYLNEWWKWSWKWKLKRISLNLLQNLEIDLWQFLILQVKRGWNMRKWKGGGNMIMQLIPVFLRGQVQNLRCTAPSPWKRQNFPVQGQNRNVRHQWTDIEWIFLVSNMLW